MKMFWFIIGWVYVLAGTIPAVIAFAVGFIFSPIYYGFLMGAEMGKDYANEKAVRWRNARS